MLWHPEHFHGDELQPSAFKTEDLLGRPGTNGKPRSVSLDQRDNISKESVDWRINRQSAKCPDRRITPLFAEMEAAEIVKSCGADGLEMFSLYHDPLEFNEETGEPANPSHYGLRSSITSFSEPKHERAHISALRAKLFEIGARRLTYDDIFPASAEPQLRDS